LAREALESVKPANITGKPDSTHSTYFAVDGPFADIEGALGELCGLLDMKTMNLGEVDDNGHT
jgi:hypothetical protein